MNPAVVLPSVGTTGEAVTALGDGTNLTGIFVLEDGGKYYTPASVVLPSTLTKIGKWTFALNPGLAYEAKMTSITLPEGLVEIGQTAFQNSKLTSVSIPDSVTTMGMGAFTGSADLTSIKLSKNVVDIPQSAFSSGTASNMSIKELVIPEGVKTIGRQAFDTAHVEKLILPSTLTTIGRDAFKNHQMTSVIIPENVTKIDRGAFNIANTSLPKKLEKVVLNEGLVEIGQQAFAGNAIEEIYLPSTLTTLGKNVFDKQTVKAIVSTEGQKSLEDSKNNAAITVEYDQNAKAITASKDKASLEFTEATYTGSAVEPKVTIEGLTEGTDYTVEYRNNTAVGTATVVVVGTGDYYGSFELPYTIKEKPAPAPAPDGGSEGEKEPGKEVPKTSDQAPIELMMGLMVLAAAGAYVGYRKSYTK